MSDDLPLKVRIALDHKALQAGLIKIGLPSSFAGVETVLLRLEVCSGSLRFRCRCGHSYAAGTLLAELTGTEDTLGAATGRAGRDLIE